MSKHFIPISHVALDEEEIAEVVAILRSGKLREGPVCQEFEEQFAARVGARYAISVSSGTAALHVAYAALLEPGDEVLVPSFTFIATASMVNMVGARPIFCDVDPRTFTLDINDARKRITARTRVIAPVHLFGNPCDVNAVRALADEYNLTVIWDAAQAHGACYNGQDVGALENVVCYSFYPSKNMTTAEGGMITTSDEALYHRSKLLRSHGQSGKYYHTLLGFNYRLTDVMAGLGLRQLEKLDEWVAQRRRNAAFLTEHLSNLMGILPPVEQSNGKSSFNLYTILLDVDQLSCSRDEFVARLHSAGVGATVNYPRPLHQQPVYADGNGDSRLPVAENLCSRVISLPVHPMLTKTDLDYVIRSVQRVVEDTYV